MQKLLSEISVIPGVAGSCIFNKTRGIVCKQFNVSLPHEITDNIGFNFVRLLQMAGMNNLNINSAHFRFDRYWLVGTPLRDGIILLTVCDLQANCSLIASTAGMLAEDMRQELDQPVPDQEKKTPANERVDGSKEESPVKNDEDIQKHFIEIENALASAIGPVAKMIMSDYVHKWRQQGPPTQERLPELLDILAEEIEDSALIEEFRSQLHYLM